MITNSNELHPSVTCKTGTYIGTYEKENNVCAFKGIPYALPITPALRWRPPQHLPHSNKTINATTFGKVCIQRSIIPVEKTSENCLSLNIWTKNIHRKNKAVMVFIPGGSYSIGGSIVPEYNGMYLANEFDDIIVVTLNYRLNLFGFIDFSNVPGGENFKTTGYNGVLDCLMALYFIHENIDAFGGDPENVTIFGESAGGGMVNLLMTTNSSKGLFKRVIAESGSVALSSTKEKFDRNHQTEEFLRITKCKSMTDLLHLSTSTIYQAMGLPTRYIGFENGNKLCDLNNFPLVGSGSILPEDSYQALCGPISRDVDFMIGTVSDELRMWVTPDSKPATDEMFSEYYKFVHYQIENAQRDMAPEKIRQCDLAYKITQEDRDSISIKYPNIWRMTELGNELIFRGPAIKAAEKHINHKSKTYMYYFSKHSTLYKWHHACHACELPYVFYHLKHNMLCGDTDPILARKIASAWVAFAKTGDPSTSYACWESYDLSERKTMYIENDNSMHMVTNPRPAMRVLCK